MSKKRESEENVSKQLIEEQADFMLRNPFQYDSPPTVYELIKIVFFFGSLLAFIRVVVVVGLVFVAFVWVLLLTSTVNKKDVYEKPYPEWRRELLIFPVACMARLMLFTLGFYRIKVIGEPSPEASFFVPNHVSLFDPPILFYLLRPVIVGKAEIFKIPVFGRILTGLQLIPVRRESKEGREWTKEVMYKFAASRALGPGKRFPPILIFPQGTTTSDQVITMFQRGAFTPGLPVQPIAIRYPHRHFDPAYVVNRRKDYYFRRLFCQFSMSVEVTFLPLHRPTEAEKKDATLFANNVRQEIADVLRCQTTDHYYLDARLYSEALHQKEEKHTLNLLEKPTEADRITSLDNFELIHVKDLLGSDGIDFKKVKRALRIFQDMDSDNSGNISFEEFATMTGLSPEERDTHLIFNFLDRDNSGTINFRELICAMAMSSATSSGESIDVLNFVFDLFDENGDGKICEKELRRIFETSLGGALQIEEKEKIEKFTKLALENGAKDKDGKLYITRETFISLLKQHPDIIRLTLGEVKTRTRLNKYDTDQLPSTSMNVKK